MLKLFTGQVEKDLTSLVQVDCKKKLFYFGTGKTKGKSVWSRTKFGENKANKELV